MERKTKFHTIKHGKFSYNKLEKDVATKLNKQRSISVKYDSVKSADHFFTNQEKKVIEKMCTDDCVLEDYEQWDEGEDKKWIMTWKVPQEYDKLIEYN